MSRLKAKLHQKRGETLAEVMVAILVSAAGMLLLSSLIMASTRIVDKGAKSMEIIYNGSTVMDTKETTSTTTVSTNKGMTVTFTNAGITVNTIYVDIYKDNPSKLVSYIQEGTQP